MPTGRFHPYWKPGSQGTCSPFTIPAVLKSVPTNRKREFAPTHSKRKNPHSQSSDNGRKDCGDFQCRIHWNKRFSCVTQHWSTAILRTRICVPEWISHKKNKLQSNFLPEQNTSRVCYGSRTIVVWDVAISTYLRYKQAIPFHWRASFFRKTTRLWIEKVKESHSYTVFRIPNKIIPESTYSDSGIFYWCFFFATKYSNGARSLPIGFVSVIANWKLRT